MEAFIVELRLIRNAQDIGIFLLILFFFRLFFLLFDHGLGSSIPVGIVLVFGPSELILLKMVGFVLLDIASEDHVELSASKWVVLHLSLYRFPRLDGPLRGALNVVVLTMFDGLGSSSFVAGRHLDIAAVEAGLFEV